MAIEVSKCEVCGKVGWNQRHHKFPNTKVNRKLYPEIDSHKNIMLCCVDCHLSKARGIVCWNEYEFITALGIEKRGKV